MFIDRARIFVQSGKGGDGMSSFRHEKFVPKGGPNGGDGGQGGNVVLVADRNVNTLVDFRFRRLFKAKPGGKGEGSNKYGRNAEDLVITVPLGTIVKDEETGQVMADLSRDGQRAIVAKGGRGGRGNWHFRTSANRTRPLPNGGTGGRTVAALELKVLADVGLLGYPSVGKSSILRKVSAAQPEVAAYHFTTLNPILGVVNLPDHRSFVMADIPGSSTAPVKASAWATISCATSNGRRSSSTSSTYRASKAATPSKTMKKSTRNWRNTVKNCRASSKS